jgi:hypothetical protein
MPIIGTPTVEGVADPVVGRVPIGAPPTTALPTPEVMACVKLGKVGEVAPAGVFAVACVLVAAVFPAA